MSVYFMIMEQQVVRFIEFYYQEPMSQKEDLRSQTIQLLQVMSEGENIIQCIKEALIMHEEFSPILLFETLSNGKQRMTRSDMVRFLEKHSIQFNNEELREYSRENRLSKQASFHEFIDSIMPFNADALRVYKESYLDKLSLRELDPEIQLLYRQLVQNQLKFIRSIDIIKNQILLSCRSEIWRVNQLIKADLVGKSKIREGKKFQQKFEDPNNEVSFIDLRRFLELWVPTHEVVLLNLMRRLRTENPLKPINLRLENGLRNMSKSKSRGRSKQLRGKSGPKAKSINYDQFKKQLDQEYQAQKNNDSLTKTKNKNKNRSKSKPKVKKQVQTRWEREKTNTNGVLLKKLIQTVISKEEIVQKLRKKLFQSKDFNMVNLFKLIDTENQGMISEESLGKFVQRSNPSSRLSWKPLIQAFAKQPQGLRFHELYLVLQPLSKDLVKLMSNKQEDPISNPFKSKTLDLVVETLKSALLSLAQINKVRGEINDKGQNVRQLFAYVDVKKRNYVTGEDFKQLLEQDEFYTDIKDMKLLFKHFGKKTDDKVEFSDFARFVEGY